MELFLIGISLILIVFLAREAWETRQERLRQKREFEKKKAQYEEWKRRKGYTQRRDP